MKDRMNLIFLICSIIVQFQYTLCNEGKARYTYSKLIKVQLPRYEEDVLSCILIVRFSASESSDTVLLYDKESLYYSDGTFKYIGKDDNSCSFEILLNDSSIFFSYDNGIPLTQKWTVYEQHVTDGSWYKTLKSWLGASEPEERTFDFYLSPQTFYQRVLMAMSGHHITRKVPYTDKTISILTQPRKYLIRQCTLLIPSDGSSRRSHEIVLYDMHSSLDQSTEFGFEFIGVGDNSCSFRIFIDKLKRKVREYFDNSWIIYENYENDERRIHRWRIHRQENLLLSMQYEFNMPSISWWQNNKKSGLYLSETSLEKTEEEFF